MLPDITFHPGRDIRLHAGGHHQMAAVSPGQAFALQAKTAILESHLIDRRPEAQVRQLPGHPTQVIGKFYPPGPRVIGIDKPVKPAFLDQIRQKTIGIAGIDRRHQILQVRSLHLRTWQHHARMPIEVGLAVEEPHPAACHVRQQGRQTEIKWPDTDTCQIKWVVHCCFLCFTLKIAALIRAASADARPPRVQSARGWKAAANGRPAAKSGSYPGNAGTTGYRTGRCLK